MGIVTKRKGCAVGVGLLALVGLLLWMPAAQAQEPVKIGVIYADVGVGAQLGIDMRDGFLLYWSEINNRAGGRTVQILTEGNTTNKPDEGLTKARKLVERDRVHLLSGVLETAIAYALRPYVIDKKIPLVTVSAGADGLTKQQRSKYFFRTSFANSDSSHPLGEWAYKQGYRKMVLMGWDQALGYEHLGGVARTFIEAGGQVIQEIYTPLGALDFAPFLSQIRRDADVVTVLFAGSDALRFVQQYAEYGLKGKIPLIGKWFVTDDVILSKQGDAALGIVTAGPWSAAVGTPANKHFLKAYAARYNRPATSYSESAYVGAQMIAAALEAIKGNIENQEAFMAALQKVEVDGPRGRVRLDAFHNPVYTMYIMRVERKGGALQNTVIASYPNTGQFWKWTPEQFMAMPAYADMKGKWAK